MQFWCEYVCESGLVSLCGIQYCTCESRLLCLYSVHVSRVLYIYWSVMSACYICEPVLSVWYICESGKSVCLVCLSAKSESLVCLPGISVSLVCLSGTVSDMSVMSVWFSI